MLIIPVMLLLAACMAGDAEPSGEKSVTVYLDYMTASDSLLFEKFTKEEKIKVYFKVLKPDSILHVIKEEHFDSWADLILVHGADKLNKGINMKLFAPIVSEKMESTIGKNYYAAKKYWCALSKSPIVLAYDRRILRKDTISFYNEVLQPKWKGKIALQAPQHSTLRVLDKSIRFLKGDRKDDFMSLLYGQAALPAEGNDLTQIRRIQEGKAQLAFIELSSLLKANERKDTLNKPLYNQVGVIFPGQLQKGCFYNVTGAGIYRYARNKKNARLLLEFLISKRAQYHFAEGRHDFPVLEGIDPETLLKPYSQFRGRFLLNKIYHKPKQKK